MKNRKVFRLNEQMMCMSKFLKKFMASPLVSLDVMNKNKVEHVSFSKMNFEFFMPHSDEQW